MTIPQFLQYIKRQPWELQYVVNFLSVHHSHANACMSNPISTAFSWHKTPEGWGFWYDIDLQTSRLTDPIANFTFNELQIALRDIYFESNPELLL